MNEIAIKQNLPKQIDKLSAQRFLYSKAKKIFYVRVTLSFILAIIATFFISTFNGSQYYIALIITFYLLIDIIFLERAESSSKKDAARIQESFDLEVFGLPWNNIVANNRIEEEKIAEYAELYRRKNGGEVDKLLNWYSPEVSKLDLTPAIAVCQRSNIYWDVSLRKQIFGALTIILIISVLAIFMFSQTPILLIYSAIPFYRVIADYAKSQKSTINNIENLKDKIENFLDNPNNFTVNQSNTLRTIQDQIFIHRETSAFVPDWFYEMNRDSQEKQMNYSADHYVDKLLNNHQ